MVSNIINIKKGFHKTKEDFLKQVRHDKMKNEYCTDNNLELIRISYKDIGIVGDILTERLGLIYVMW